MAPAASDEAELRADQTWLKEEGAAAQVPAKDTQTQQLVEANQKLATAAMHAEAAAKACAEKLEEVSRATTVDPLTDLPNRALLLDRLTHAIAGVRRRGGRLALLFVDLDNFKQINDSLGHGGGDGALRVAAQCLLEAVRDEDTVSRHGGDEFVILLESVSQASDAVLVAEKMIAALAAPHTAGEHEVRLSASIGISIHPDHGDDADTLIERADAAMYRAKKHGVSCLVHGEGPAPDGR